MAELLLYIYDFGQDITGKQGEWLDGDRWASGFGISSFMFKYANVCKNLESKDGNKMGSIQVLKWRDGDIERIDEGKNGLWTCFIINLSNRHPADYLHKDIFLYYKFSDFGGDYIVLNVQSFAPKSNWPTSKINI